MLDRASKKRECSGSSEPPEKTEPLLAPRSMLPGEIQLVVGSVSQTARLQSFCPVSQKEERTSTPSLFFFFS